MSFQIITDSASDIPQETAEKWGITVMPIHTRFGEEEYLDGVTLKPVQFFEKLVEYGEKGEIPRTSQITPYEFGQVFEKAVRAGEGVLCITMSSGVSGTYQSACAAASEFEDRVIVIDSRQFCISLYILVEYACRCRQEGKTLEETAELVRDVMSRVHVISVFATLDYLRLGGRLSAAAALAGNLLSIKPVITITDGVVDVIARARGTRKANGMLTDFILSHGGIDASMPYCLGFTGFSDETLKKSIAENRQSYQSALSAVIPGESGIDRIGDYMKIVPVGATVGTYAGPGAIALAFFEGGQ